MLKHKSVLEKVVFHIYWWNFTTLPCSVLHFVNRNDLIKVLRRLWFRYFVETAKFSIPPSLLKSVQRLRIREYWVFVQKQYRFFIITFSINIKVFFSYSQKPFLLKMLKFIAETFSNIRCLWKTEVVLKLKICLTESQAMIF